MRIISGTYKGKLIIAPKKLPVRPTTDMAKEGMFNILNNHYYFNEISFLDLFAGTGNISYEFASRGCPSVTSVDADPGCIKFINQKSKELDFQITAIKSDVFAYLKKAPARADVIFADPPYDMAVEDFAKIPELVFQGGMLLPDGMLIVEHSKHTDLSHLHYFSKGRRYGGSGFSFFEMPPNP
ncbi:MAG: RsmD family RNA methyltransferase [Sediminicola sp.]|tara:strand:- start:153965 stop:154513 length:549 start_codon:yes stop_codon:yes gene_type:complete